jgi:hypothetical protein
MIIWPLLVECLSSESTSLSPLGLLQKSIRLTFGCSCAVRRYNQSFRSDDERTFDNIG